MEVMDRISSEMTKAAKDKDKEKLSALRMVKSALHNKEIDLKDQFGEKEILQVLSSMIKQRKDSVEQFRNGGRLELATKEEKEIEVIQGFMPEQMSEAEVKAEIENAIDETGATSIRDMGKCYEVSYAQDNRKGRWKSCGRDG